MGRLIQAAIVRICNFSELDLKGLRKIDDFTYICYVCYIIKLSRSY